MRWIQIRENDFGGDPGGDLNASKRGTREQAKQRDTRRARGKHSPAYHSMSRGGCQGEYTQGGVSGSGRGSGGASGASTAATAAGHA